MKLTLLKKVSKVVHFTDFFLCACSMYSYLEFKLKNNNTIFTVSKIQTMKKLNNPMTTLFTELFLTIVRFNLLEQWHSHKNKETFYPFFLRNLSLFL